jgi:hypothetical protein
LKAWRIDVGARMAEIQPRMRSNASIAALIDRDPLFLAAAGRSALLAFGILFDVAAVGALSIGASVRLYDARRHRRWLLRLMFGIFDAATHRIFFPFWLINGYETLWLR